MAVEETPVLVGIMYPAQVTLPDGRCLRRVKLAVTELYVYVFTAPEVLAYFSLYSTADIPSRLAPRSALWTVQTGDGELSARRMSGCGCGVPLKSWKPFTPQRWSVR